MLRGRVDGREREAKVRRCATPFFTEHSRDSIEQREREGRERTHGPEQDE